MPLVFFLMVTVLFFCCLPLLLLALGALCTFLGVLLELLERARRLIARGVLWAFSFIICYLIFFGF